MVSGGVQSEGDGSDDLRNAGDSSVFRGLGEGMCVCLCVCA